MTKNECKSLRAGDRVRAANGQTGIVVINMGSQITIQWDDGKQITGPHRFAWMVEQISCALHQVTLTNRYTKRTRNNP